MISDINVGLQPQRFKLYICKPNREVIGSLKEVYNVKRNKKLGNVYTLDFSIPYQIEKNHQLVDNPNIYNTKYRYLVKYVEGSTTEWYMINTPTDTMESDVDYKSIQCYSLAYELADKNIRNYNVTSYKASQVLQDALSETIWSIGTVDASYDLLFRSFDVSNSSVLDFIYEIANTFNALVIFDDINRKVNLYNFDTYGTNKYLTVSYGKLLKNATKVQNSDELCTRLKVFGKNGISIKGVVSTGQNYIEDYSYFQSNGYFSASLNTALTNYNSLITANEATFQGYLTQLNADQITLTTKQNELAVLQNDLAVIEDQISAANYNGTSTTALVSQKTAKQSAITTKKSEVNAAQASVNTDNANIAALKNTLSVSSNFTSAQITEWNQFIIVKTFENNNIDDEIELLNLAKQEIAKIRQPKIIVNISIVNFMECIQEQRNWKKELLLGDIITIKNDKLKINVQAKIIELDYDYESGDVNVVISNVRELLDDKARFLSDLYKSVSTSTSVNMDKYKWDQSYHDVNDVNTILKNKWDATAREIQASSDNTVSISRKGIVITDPNDANKVLIAQKGLLAISSNGGNTWSTAVDSTGVYAQRLVGQVIAGVNLTITNSSGTFTVNQTGVTMSNLGLTITSTGGNGISLTPTNGLIITRSDNKFRSWFNATNGIQLQTSADNGATWNDALKTDTNGNLTLNNITANTITANSATINNSNFNNGAIVGSSISVGGGTFTVTQAGAMTATNATIYGTVNATAGSIGGFTIASNKLTGGTIESNSTINVTTNLTVGNNIYLTSQNGAITQSIIFPGSGNISFSSSGSGTLKLESAGSVIVNASVFEWLTGGSYETVATHEWIQRNPQTAVFG